MGEHRNYLSEDSDSDKEAPPAFIQLDLDPYELEERKAVRNAGQEVNFKEKNMKTEIKFVKKVESKVPTQESQSEATERSEVPSEKSEKPAPEVIIEKPPEPEIDIVE